MKKTLGILCVLLLLLLAASPALAANIRISTQPATITSAGTATLQFTIINDSTAAMQDITVSGYSTNGDYALGYSIQPADSLSFSIKNISVTEDMLGDALLYTFQWTENGQRKTTTASVSLGGVPEVAPPIVDMTATRTASKNAGKEGEKITLTYNINNPGDLPMTDIMIKDEGIAGTTAIASSLKLDAFASRTVTHEYTLGKQNTTSKPIITYKINGQTKTLALDALNLTVTDVRLLVSVTQSDPTPEGVLFTLVLKNDGNVNVSNIAVTDELANKVNEDTFTLQAGQEKTLSFSVAPADTVRSIVFSIKGKDAQGQAYEDKTRGYEIFPYVDEESIAFTMTAAPVEPLNEAGRMKVRFTIQNDSRVDLTEAVITESMIDVVETIGVLQRGETVIEKDIFVGDPRELAFTLSAVDPSGTSREKYASMTAAHIETPAPLPQESIAPEAEDEPAESEGQNIFVTILIVLAGLMAVAGIALIVLSIFERRRNASMQDFDDDEEEEFVAPARKPRGRKAREQDAEEEEDFPAPLPQSEYVVPPRRQYTPPEEVRPAPSEPRPQPPAYRPMQQSSAPQSPAPVRSTGQQAPTEQTQRVYVPGIEHTPAPVQENPAQTQRVYVPMSQRQRPPESPGEASRPQATPMEEQPPKPPSPVARNRVHRVRPTNDDQ